MQSKGAGLAFDTIMAFGENGAKPHAHRSDRELREGDFITMDFGAKWQGYCSDMTRTVAFGSIDGRKAEAYDTVLQANMRGVASLRAGVIGKQVQDDIRAFFKERGQSDRFHGGQRRSGNKRSLLSGSRNGGSGCRCLRP